MNVTLPPGSYVLTADDYADVRRVMARLYDGSALNSEGLKNLARVLDNATRGAVRVRDLVEADDLRKESCDVGAGHRSSER